MIQINTIEPQIVGLYNPEGIYLGSINEYEFNDIRLQIKSEKVNGWYCMYRNQKVFINTDGRIKDWPEGFFDLYETQLMNLL